MEPVALGGGRFLWHEGGLPEDRPWVLMVLALPEGHTITNASPAPISVKVFKDRRLAVQWSPVNDAKGNANVEWTLAEFEGDLEAEKDRLNGLYAGAPPPGPPAAEEMQANVIFPLHGIRTRAQWQRAFADVAQQAHYICRMEKWYFGRFSIFQFLSPWSRDAKVRWFRDVYHDEVSLLLEKEERPSIVAHSFGTYILGNALLKYPYIRFNKVILCGSILPRDFPWDQLIARGQVQAVRNEYGVNDVWAKRVAGFIPQTGPSGMRKFTREHPRLDQVEFRYDHGEYFEKGHMQAYWIPFLEKDFDLIPAKKADVVDPKRTYPWLLYSIYAAFLLLVVAAAAYWFGLLT
jgi:pimeloyl-ACP methyl ester carboxylesterase